MGFGHSRQRVVVEVTALVGGALLLGWLAWIGIRAMAVAAVERAPYSYDQKLGGMVAGQVETASTLCTNPALVEAVRSVAALLEPGLPAEARSVNLRVIEDESENAFALPGGHVFVHTGLLAKLESPDELAGVLGHEMGHAVLRHGTKGIAQSLGLGLAVSIVFGGLDAGTAALAAVAGDLGQLAYGRDAEREADDFGARLLLDVGLDPSALGRFLGRMAAHPVPKWLSTHPEPGERETRLRDRFGGERPRTEPPSLPTLEVLKAPCVAK